MTAPRPLDAFADRPALRGRVFASLDPSTAAAAWRSPSGAVLLCWPEHRRAPTFMSQAWDAVSGCALDSALTYDLLGAFLTAEDVDRASATWDSLLDRDENRRRRIAVVQAAAPRRARARSLQLRQLRLGEPPPGSCAVAAHLAESDVDEAGEPAVVVRFPDGRGWWPCGVSPAPWPWERPQRPDVVLRVLAVGLSDEQCAEVADLEAADATEAAVRRIAGLP